MFLKVIFKTIKTTGERKMHYRLCESYRIDDTVRNQTILHLGTLEELPETDQKKALALRIDELVKLSYTGKQSLFGSSDAVIEALAQKFFAVIQEKHRLDIAAGKDFQRMDTDSTENKYIKETVTEWLCMQALDQLGISGFLANKEWSSERIQLGLTQHQSCCPSCKRTAYQPMDQRKFSRVRTDRLSGGEDNQGQTL